MEGACRRPLERCPPRPRLPCPGADAFARGWRRSSRAAALLAEVSQAELLPLRLPGKLESGQGSVRLIVMEYLESVSIAPPPEGRPMHATPPRGFKWRTIFSGSPTDSSSPVLSTASETIRLAK